MNHKNCFSFKDRSANGTSAIARTWRRSTSRLQTVAQTVFRIYVHRVKRIGWRSILPTSVPHGWDTLQPSHQLTTCKLAIITLKLS